MELAGRDLFGSHFSIDGVEFAGRLDPLIIADLLTAEGFSVARNQVELNHPIKTIGLTNVAIALHPEVEVTVTLNIARSTDEAERQAQGETLTTAEAIYGEDINDNARPDTFFDPNAEFEGEEEEVQAEQE